MKGLRISRWLSLFLAGSLAFLAYPAQAGGSRITRGDVEAIFNAFATGGRVVLFKASSTSGMHAAPAELLGSNGAIRPLDPWDGVRLCVDDWHAILLGIFDGGDTSYTMLDARDYLGAVQLAFAVDDEPLPTVRTPIKRFLQPDNLGLDVAYGFQEGKILGPGELQVGDHKLQMTATFPGEGSFDWVITFHVDGSESSTCN